jgi:hypothetical protein
VYLGKGVSLYFVEEANYFLPILVVGAGREKGI